MSPDRFRDQLRQQLVFIRNSYESYDRGDRSEGIRIGKFASHPWILSSTKRLLPAPQWWREPVTIVDAGVRATREAIALVAANKDGGSHVDAKLTAEYQKLKTGLWAKMDTGKPVPGHHLLYLRQMEFEILNSPELVALAAAP